MVRVRLVRPIGYRRLGTELEVPSGTAETWISQGKAEPVGPLPENATKSVLDDTALPPPARHAEPARQRRQRVAV